MREWPFQASRGFAPPATLSNALPAQISKI
jgi:hypothetical protein